MTIKISREIIILKSEKCITTADHLLMLCKMMEASNETIASAEDAA